jgi:hypothetical protein
MSSPQNTQNSQDLQVGTWGGDHISMEVTARGATFEFDCAHGSLDQKIVLDSEGKFSMRGKFVLERGGPLVQGDEQKAEEAIYSGSVKGEALNLTITFAASNETIGTYTLSFGKVGRIRKCK